MESISISVMDKARVESQERSGLVLRKPYAPAYGFQKQEEGRFQKSKDKIDKSKVS
jgi:hypothetical protein